MTQNKDESVKSPCFVEVADLKSLGRLVCAIERITMPLFAFNSGSDVILATQLDLLMERSFFYFARTTERGNFLAYRNSLGVEDVHLSNNHHERSYVYSPVISLKRLPPQFNSALSGSNEHQSKFLPMEVNDLSNLAKVASYKTIFEEPPLPLFTFRHEKRWMMGTFTKMNESTDESLFFHVYLDEEPSSGFLSYSTARPDDALFTNRIDGHGSVFIKVIKLSNGHPMIDVDI